MTIRGGSIRRGAAGTGSTVSSSSGFTPKDFTASGTDYLNIGNQYQLQRTASAPTLSVGTAYTVMVTFRLKSGSIAGSYSVQQGLFRIGGNNADNSAQFCFGSSANNTGHLFWNGGGTY